MNINVKWLDVTQSDTGTVLGAKRLTWARCSQDALRRSPGFLWIIQAPGAVGPAAITALLSALFQRKCWNVQTQSVGAALRTRCVSVSFILWLGGIRSVCLAYEWPRGPRRPHQEQPEPSGSSALHQRAIFKALSGCLVELTWTSSLRSQD